MDQKILQDCPPLLRDFLFYMETIRGRSARTVDGYYVDLRLFHRYIKQRKLGIDSDKPIGEVRIADVPTEAICAVTLSDVYEYLVYAQSSRGNSQKTRARKVSSLRSYYKYITTKTSLLEVSPVKDLDLPAVRQTLPKYLSLEESTELLQAADHNDSARDFCIVTLLLNCGMRVSELVGIDLGDIKNKDRTLRLLGKGNKERIIYLNAACMDSIEGWMAERQQMKAKCNALFLSRTGGRLTTRRVEQIVERQLKEAGLSGRGYSPHKLRHTAATLMYQYGGSDVRVLKEILGHADLSTTEIYTHVSSRQMEEAIGSNPLAKAKRQKPAKGSGAKGSEQEDPED